MDDYQSNLDAFNTAKDQLSGLVDQVKGLQSTKQDAVDKLGTVLETGGNIGSGVMGVLGTLEQISKGTQLEGTISSLKTQLSTLRDGLADGIQKGVESGISKAADAAKNLTGNNEQLNSMIDNAAGAARTTTNTAISQAAGGDIGGLMDTAKTAGNTMLTTGSDTLQLVRGGVADAGKAVQSGARSLISNVEQGVSNAVNTGSETMTGLANQGIAMASNMGARASSTVSGMLSEGSSLAKTIPSTARNIVSQAQSQVSPSTGATTDAVPEFPDVELPSFEGLSDFPVSAAPIANLFGLVPKTTLATLSQSAPEVESTVTNLVSGLSSASRSAVDGTAIPSRVLGIINKGQRGDSTIARALGLTGEKATPSQLTTPIQKPAVMPTMEDYQNVSAFSDPSETILTKYLPKGDFGDLEASYIASGIPKEVLAQARQQEGSSLIGKQVQPSTFDNTVPQSRITAPEPNAQPSQPMDEPITGTSNNPSLSPSVQAQTKPQVSVSEPESAPSAPKPMDIQPTAATEGGEVAEGATAAAAGGEIEAGAAGGPEGLVAGAILAGITSLIGGLIKDFHKSAPSIPIFQTTGAAMSPQEQVNAATAF